MPERLRRLRRTPTLRALFEETRLHTNDLVYPIFVQEDLEEPEPIPSMPGQSRLPISSLDDLTVELKDLGVRAVLVFGIPATKQDHALNAMNVDGIVPRAVRALKDADPNLVVITDICVCSYTTHGHCGILRDNRVDQEETLRVLRLIALAHSKAGADIVAPSSMMDGQVEAVRDALNGLDHYETAVMGYSAKFASSFYGPFREAADSAPAFGDRRAYQHDAANIRHARREILTDVAEGADIVMVKPGLPYLDVVRLAREITDLPVAAYQVSGEYAMIKAAAEKGWVDERAVVMESLLAFRRAGADLILTYYAKDVARWLRESA